MGSDINCRRFFIMKHQGSDTLQVATCLSQHKAHVSSFLQRRAEDSSNKPFVQDNPDASRCCASSSARRPPQCPGTWPSFQMARGLADLFSGWRTSSSGLRVDGISPQDEQHHHLGPTTPAHPIGALASTPGLSSGGRSRPTGSSAAPSAESALKKALALATSEAAEEIRAKRETEILATVIYGRGATATFAAAALSYLERRSSGFSGRSSRHFGTTPLAKIDQDAIDRGTEAVTRTPRRQPATAVLRHRLCRSSITPRSGDGAQCRSSSGLSRPVAFGGSYDRRGRRL